MATAEPSASDIRVQDYLNDKFQTLADLNTLDNLLESVQTQQNQLRAQLNTSESTLDTAQESLSTHSAHLQTTVQSFHAKQANIDRRLRATTSSDTAEEASIAFTSTVDKLRRLDVATSYVSLLQTVQTLSAEARNHINENNPKAALEPYGKLQELAKELRSRDDAQDGVAVHLVEYVERSMGELWDEMKGKLAGAFESVVNKIGWPMKDEVEMKGREKEFVDAFEKLLVLQTPELGDGGEKVMLPFEVLVKPLALRFRYHFEGDRPTNRVDKPEWFLAHLSELVVKHSGFLTGHVQPIFAISDNPNISSRDAVVEFITALLPVLRKKIRTLLPQISEAQLLSHFIHEMIKFDAQLREEFYYAPFGCQGAWKGMTHEVLVVQNGFTGWLKAEKEFALSRYQTILAADDAWQLDYDSVEPTESKPTKSAIRLKDLLETVTDSYRPLISFSQRLRFLIDIQISILDQYHDVLHSGVEKFKVMSSSIARAVQGMGKEEIASMSGLGGLERLCRVYGSAIFMENCMRDWGEDIFFLELWEDLQLRASKGNPGKALAGDMNIQDVANVTSSAVVSGDDDGALFDETAGSYRQLRKMTEEMIAEQVIHAVREELKPYTKIALWSSSVDPSTLATSAEMVTPVTTLQLYLSFLQRTLSPIAYRRIFRALSASLNSFFLDSIIHRNQFSHAGGLQLQKDVMELWKAGGGGPEMEALPKNLAGVFRLMTMEVEELRATVKGVFEDNEKAREILGELGIALPVNDARGILQRRVEAWA